MVDAGVFLGTGDETECARCGEPMSDADGAECTSEKCVKFIAWAESAQESELSDSLE